jgi:ATP-dependent protease ClpP protease subunit
MNNDNNNEFPMIPFFQNKETIKSFKRIIPVTIYDFYIIDDIEEPEKYLELLQTLKSAEPYDTIFIYLNTQGGSLTTTIQIMSAMNSSAAKVVTCLEGHVCSAGTFIFLKGDIKVINPHGTVMIHNYSQTSSGKGHEVITQINYMNTYFNKLAIDIYTDFLTSEEIEYIKNGNDIYMDSHEVVERLKNNGHDYVYTGSDLDLGVDIKSNLKSNLKSKLKSNDDDTIDTSISDKKTTSTKKSSNK